MAQQNDHKIIRWVVSIVLLILLGAVIYFIISMLNGKTTTTGQNPDDIEGQSLVCEKNNINYPIFTYYNTDKKELKITANFYDDKINAISLAYTMYYSDAQLITGSEAHNHAAMNISFGKNSLGPDSFNAHYSKMEDAMIMRLYATSNELNSVSAKYFLIRLKEDQISLPNTPAEYQENYKAQGLTCKLSS